MQALTLRSVPPEGGASGAGKGEAATHTGTEESGVRRYRRSRTRHVMFGSRASIHEAVSVQPPRALKGEAPKKAPSARLFSSLPFPPPPSPLPPLRTITAGGSAAAKLVGKTSGSRARRARARRVLGRVQNVEAEPEGPRWRETEPRSTRGPRAPPYTL